MTDAAPPPRGPPCEACGCHAIEHEHHVDEAYRRVPGRCLTCPCEGFTAGGQTVAGFVYDDQVDW